MDLLKRCPWRGTDLLYLNYHDHEWGVPVKDDGLLFEFMVLESFQAGLIWLTILRKREAFHHAFLGFRPDEVAEFSAADRIRLLNDRSIVRNEAKIRSAIHNARIVLKIKECYGSLSHYFWRFVEDRPIVHHWDRLQQVPATIPLAVTISKDLKQQGIRFFGPVITYAHMQATGMVNDHLSQCHRYEAILQAYINDRNTPTMGRNR